MSRREDIDNAIWSDPDFEALSLSATALYLWSFTNPRCGMAGLYKVSHRAMTESKVSPDDLEAVLAELAAARFLYYQDGVMFVRARVKHMRQRTEQIAKSIRTDVSKIAAGHPARDLWIEENARAPWLVRFLGEGWEFYAVPDGESLVTLGGATGEARQKGPLGPNKRGSSEGRPTLQGKGNGSGTGNGPLGRGVGREEPSQREQFEEMARTEFPDVPVRRVQTYFRQLKEDHGSTPSVEQVRARLLQDGYAEAAAA